MTAIVRIRSHFFQIADRMGVKIVGYTNDYVVLRDCQCQWIAVRADMEGALEMWADADDAIDGYGYDAACARSANYDKFCGRANSVREETVPADDLAELRDDLNMDEDDGPITSL